jgi:tetratricopeptide (TPR) repeat protein
MAGVFLSYRRTERRRAGRVARNLANRFGKDLVFQDVEDIEAGDRWRESIQAAIMSAEVVVAAIGPRWLVDEQGRRRLNDPDDVLRTELVEALNLEKAIVPVLLGGAEMPAPKDIPAALAEVSERQAIRVDDRTWNKDIERLLARLRALLLPNRATEPLERVQREVHELQVQFFKRLQSDLDVPGSLELAQRTLVTLNHVSPLYPDDVYLQIARAYSHKNCAIALLELDRATEASDNLDTADEVFSTLLDEYPGDASVWDGKGSVLATRGELKESLAYFDRAIELRPDYVEARQNRDAVLSALEGQSTP